MGKWGRGKGKGQGRDGHGREGDGTGVLRLFCDNFETYATANFPLHETWTVVPVPGYQLPVQSGLVRSLVELQPSMVFLLWYFYGFFKVFVNKK